MLSTPIDSNLVDDDYSLLTSDMTADEAAQLAPVFQTLTDHLSLDGAVLLCHSRSLWNQLYFTTARSLDSEFIESLLPQFRAESRWQCPAGILDFALPGHDELLALTKFSEPLNIELSLCVMLKAGTTADEALFNRLQPYLLMLTTLCEHITQQRNLQARLIKKKRLGSIIEATGAGTWEMEVRTQRVQLNARWANMLGYELNELCPLSLDTLFNAMHPEDRDKARALLHDCLQGRTEYYDFECRMRHKNGEWLWFLEHGKVTEVNATGEPLLMAGTHTEINEKKRIEIALAEKASFQQLMFDHLPVYLFVKDTDYRIVMANDKFISLYPPEKRDNVIGFTTVEEYNKDEAAQFLRMDILAFASGSSENEEQIQFPNGEIRTLWTKKIRFEDARGQSFILGVATDITNVKASELAMQLAKNEAEQANQAKSEFLATMSHEIRTPMNGIMGMLELAVQQASDEQQKRRLELAHNSASALLTIINDILDFSKIEAQKMELEYAPIEIDLLVQRIIEEQLTHLNDKPVQLLVDLSALPFSSLTGDEVRLGQVLTNLLSNAVKFTPEGEVSLKIRGIRLDSEHILLEITVEDTGIGMTDAQQQVLFQPFTQADSSTTRRFGGTGLGLSIVQRLTDLMKGKVTVTSKLNEGSQFTATATLTSPVRQQQLPEVGGVIVLSSRHTQARLLCKQLAAWKVRFVLIDSLDALTEFSEKMPPNMDWLIIDSALQTKFSTWKNSKEHPHRVTSLPVNQAVLADRNTSCHATPPNEQKLHTLNKPVLRHELFSLLQGSARDVSNNSDASFVPTRETAVPTGRIMIAEDNPINREVAYYMLQDSGFSVVSAEDGKHAIDLLKTTNDIELILMDCRMPVMDGFAATHAIRTGKAGEHYKNIPIVACTANASMQDKQECLQAGMDAYITKPLRKKILLDTILAMLKPDYTI
ncbi:MAG: ATP-binding protein [Pseudomonadota bacterium]|nr:ATP-binding protein [Pseudomonadota bacterium]